MGQAGFDVVVIGAGVIGLSIAARLASDRRSVLILERDSGFARGITSRNSEVIHAGIYYPAGSLKATSCVEGRAQLYAWCEARGVPHSRLGKLIVASDEDEISSLDDLLVRGEANGVSGLRLLDADAVARLEPAVRAEAALESSETGIVDAYELCLSLLAAAEARGAVLALEREVVGLEQAAVGWRIEVAAPSGSEVIEATCVIDAAGLAADHIASLAGIDVDAAGWRQHPCKGDYFVVAPGTGKRGVLPSRLIYPVPQQAGLGIHATLDMAGRIRFGPDAEYVSDADMSIDPAKGSAFSAAASRYLPSLTGVPLVPDYAGIRPKLAAEGEAFRDFVVEEASSLGAPGLIACVGIESPGLTAALALAARVETLLT